VGGLVEGSGHRWPVLGTWLASWVGWWRDPATGGRILALRRPSLATRAVGADARAVGADAGAPGAAASAAPGHRWRGAGPPLARRRPGLATHRCPRWRTQSPAVRCRLPDPGIRQGSQTCNAGRRSRSPWTSSSALCPTPCRTPPVRRSTSRSSSSARIVTQIHRSADPPLRRSAVPPVSGSVRAAARPARPSPCPVQR